MRRPKPKAPALLPLRLAQAQEFIRSSYGSVVQVETATLGDARGRILARELPAPVALPRHDLSAVDGYALRRADLGDAEPARLRVVGRSAAGHPSGRKLQPGEALRILTGATVPDGADCVLMQEGCERLGDWITIPAAASRRSNIRRAGEDLAAGSLALAAGSRLGAADLALAAALNVTTLPVFRPLRVSLFSTGDELRDPGETLGAGQVVDANRPLLRALLAERGAEVHDLGILRDEPETMIAALREAAAESDLIVTSGGMSVGDEDHLTQVIRRRGYLELWRLKIKPGKPVGLGDIDDCPILALPGNPLAAVVTCLVLGTPLLARLGGARDLEPLSLWLPAAVPLAKAAGRWEAWPARLVRSPQGLTAVEPLPKGGSAMLSTLAAADGFLCLPEEVESLVVGDPVQFLPLGR